MYSFNKNNKNILTTRKTDKNIFNINIFKLFNDILYYYNVDIKWVKSILNTNNYNKELYDSIFNITDQIEITDIIINYNIFVESKINSVVMFIKTKMDNIIFKNKITHFDEINIKNKFIIDLFDLLPYTDNTTSNKKNIHINVDTLTFTKLQNFKVENKEYKITGNNQYYAEYLKNLLKENNINYVNEVDSDNIMYWFNKEFKYNYKSHIDYVFKFFDIEPYSIMENIEDINYIDLANKLQDDRQFTYLFQYKNIEYIMAMMQYLLDKMILHDDNFIHYNKIFIRIFYLSYNYKMYVLMIKGLNEFIKECNSVDIYFVNYFKQIILKHFIHIYPDIEYKDDLAYKFLTNEYLSTLKLDKLNNDKDYEIFLNKYNINNNFFTMKNRFHMDEMSNKSPFIRLTINYINNGKSFDESELKDINWQLNLKIVSLTKFLYVFTRNIVNTYKWKHNNYYIEYILKKSNLIIKNMFKIKDIAHQHSLQRLISLISATHIIQARYNLDNNKLDTEIIIQNFEDDVLNFINNNFHTTTSGVFMKTIQTLGEVQGLYNALPFYKRKNLTDIYMKELKKYINLQMNTDFFVAYNMNLQSDKNKNISIVQFVENSIIFNYYSMFQKQKSFVTNEHYNISGGLYKLIDIFNTYQQGKQKLDEIIISNLYDKDIKIAY